MTSRTRRSVAASPWLTMGPVLSVGFAIGASQNIMAPHLTAIAKSFDLSNNERDIILGGWMSTAFFVIGGPVSIIVGTLADRVSRKQLVMLLAAAGAITIFFTSVSWAIWQLLVLRVLLGAIYGSLNPVLFSIVGDLFPPSKRPALASAVSLAVGGGTAIGQIFSGAAAGLGWRIPYVIVSLLCCCAGAIVWFVAQEPVRGAAEKDPIRSSDHSPSTTQTVQAAPVDKPITWQEMREQLVASFSSPQVRRALSIRTNQLVFLQALFGTIPWSVITVFLPDYLAQEQQFSIPQATFLVMLFGIGAAVGGVIGGSVLGSMLYRAGSSFVAMGFGLIQACSALPMLYIINRDNTDKSVVLLYVVAILAGFFAAMTGPNLKAMLMNVNVPQTRGAVFTFANLSDSLSKGLAPYVLGAAISLTGWARATVFTGAMFGWVVSGMIIFAISAFITRDEDAAKTRGSDIAMASPQISRKPSH